MTERLNTLHAEMRERFLEDNKANVLAAVNVAIANGAPLDELVVALIQVNDPFGAPVARSMGCDVEGLIRRTPAGRLPTFLQTTSRAAVVSHFNKYFPDLVRKLEQTTAEKVWVLVADAGGPGLFSVGVEKLNPTGGGEA